MGVQGIRKVGRLLLICLIERLTIEFKCDGKFCWYYVLKTVFQKHLLLCSNCSNRNLTLRESYIFNNNYNGENTEYLHILFTSYTDKFFLELH